MEQLPHSLHKRIHDYFFPGVRNDYKPHFFGIRSLSVVVIGVALLQAAYFAQTKLVFHHTHFLASVLPGVLTGLTNDDRVAANLGTLVNDPKLAEAAQLAANDMAAKGYFAHVSPDGKNPWYWLGQVGYQYSYSGQNLAVDFTDSQDVEQAWLNSPTHRANIMKAQYTNIGIAVANGSYEGKSVTFVVQYFATPKGATETASAVHTIASTVTAPAVHVSIANLTPNRTKPTTASTTEPTETASSTLAASTTLALADAPTTASDTEQVLGATYPPDASQSGVQGATAASQSFLGKVTTSPHHTVIYLLAILCAGIVLLLLISLLMHVRAQCIEVMGGGLMLLILVLLFLLGNVAFTPGVTLPSDTGNSMIETGTTTQ